MSFSILTLGHGGGVPTGGGKGNTNFALVEGHHKGEDPLTALRSSRYWLVDCGPETLDFLTESGCMPEPALQNLQGVIVTHCHADHSGGLPGLAWRLKYVEQRKVDLVFHPDLKPLLASQLVETEYGTFGHIDWTEFWDIRCGSGHVLPGSNFNIVFWTANHNIPNWPNFSVEVMFFGTGSGSIPKIVATVFFSGDTASPVMALHNKAHLDQMTLVYHDHQTYNADPKTAVHCHYDWLRDATTPEARSKILLAHAVPPACHVEDGFRGHAFRGHWETV